MIYKNPELKNKTALVVGCGGLGGYVIEELSRAGIGELILLDGDSFSQSNMNRQLLADFDTLGKMKAEVYAKRLKKTSVANVKFFNQFLTKDNANLIEETDIVLDCVDNLSTREFMSIECKKRGKILVSAAVEGEQGQALICFPEEDSFERLFSKAVETPHDTISYAVATVASIQSALAIKAMCGIAEEFRNKIVLIDLESMMVKILEL